MILPSDIQGTLHYRSDNRLIVYRIFLGILFWKFLDKLYEIRNPTIRDRYLAEIIYNDEFNKALSEDALTEDELIEFLIENQFWDWSKEEELQNIGRKIEDLKVQAYESAFKSQTKDTIKREIKVQKERMMKLYSTRHQYDYISADGVASQVKLKFLLGSSVYINQERAFTDVWSIDSFLLDSLVQYWTNNIIQEEDYRIIARNEPWRSYWNATKGASYVFSPCVTDLSDEQRALILWSIFYDNIFSHPECPPDNFFDDDDLIDGWVILQSRKRKQSQYESGTRKSLNNPTIANSSEIFLVAETREDAKKIDELNVGNNKFIKKQRDLLIKQKGTVSIMDLPDIQQDLQMALMEKFKKNLEGGNK